MGKLKVEAFTFAVILLLTCLGGAADKSGGQHSFKAELSGSEEVPPVKTEARGQATIQVSKGGNQLTYVLSISHIKGVTAAYIQAGRKGENGPLVIELFPEPKKEDIGGTLLAEGKIEPYLLVGPLQEGSVHSLIQLMEAGGAYINILTKKHPNGEIRGQIK